MAVRTGWNPLVAQQRQPAVLALELAQPPQDARSLRVNLHAIAPVEFRGFDDALVVLAQQRTTRRGVRQPQIDALAPHAARPVAHDEHPQPIALRRVPRIVDTRVSDHRSSGVGCRWAVQAGGSLAGNDSIDASSTTSRAASSSAIACP